VTAFLVTFWAPKSDKEKQPFYFFHLFVEKGGAKTIDGPRRFPHRKAIPHGSPAFALAAAIIAVVWAARVSPCSTRCGPPKRGQNNLFSEKMYNTKFPACWSLHSAAE